MFLLAIGFSFTDNKFLFFVLCFATLVEYYKEYMFGDKKDYSMQENIAAIKKVSFHMIFLSSICMCFIFLILFLISDINKYVIPIYIVFISFSCICFWYCKRKKNFIFSVTEWFINFVRTHFITWIFASCLLISQQNLYITNDLIQTLITIFVFFPPVVALLDKNNEFKNPIIRQTIFLIISLLFLILLKEMKIQNFSFSTKESNGITVIFMLIKLLITSCSYFWIIQISYLSIKSCISQDNNIIK